MKKAKEYFNDFKEDLHKGLPEKEAVGKVICGLSGDILEIKKMRNLSDTSNSNLAVFKEVDMKWKAFVRLVNADNSERCFNPEGFKNIIISKVPKLKNFI